MVYGSELIVDGQKKGRQRPGLESPGTRTLESVRYRRSLTMESDGFRRPLRDVEGHWTLGPATAEFKVPSLKLGRPEGLPPSSAFFRLLSPSSAMGGGTEV